METIMKENERLDSFGLQSLLGGYVVVNYQNGTFSDLFPIYFVSM